MKLKLILTCLMLGGLSLISEAQVTPAQSGTPAIITDENNADVTPHGVSSNTHRGTHTGKMGKDHNERNEGRPADPHYGSGTDRHSTNTTDFDTTNQRNVSGRGTRGMRPGVGEDAKVRVKEDGDELKIKMERPGFKGKVEIDKDDNTMRITTDRAGGEKVKETYPVPEWVATHGYTFNRHVYFPDLHTFYEPARGYVYWNNGAWQSSMDKPASLRNVDLNTVRIQMIEDIDLNTAPETRYIHYRNNYPPKPVTGIIVIVPVVE